METLRAYGQRAADDLRCEIQELKIEKEQTVHQLCNIQLKINTKETRLKDLLNDLAANTQGTTNGPGGGMFKVGADLDRKMTGNCDAAQAVSNIENWAKQTNVTDKQNYFHEQNDAVDTH